MVACKLVACAQEEGEPSIKAIADTDFELADFNLGTDSTYSEDLTLPNGDKTFEIVVAKPHTVGTVLNKHTEYAITVKTSMENYPESELTVNRRYSDFEWLFNRLTRTFPGRVIPPIPEKQTRNRFDKDFVEGRRLGLQKFLDEVTRDPMFAVTYDVQVFLTASSEGMNAARSVLPAGDGALTDMMNKAVAATRTGMSKVIETTTGNALETVDQNAEFGDVEYNLVKYSEQMRKVIVAEEKMVQTQATSAKALMDAAGYFTNFVMVARTFEDVDALDYFTKVSDNLKEVGNFKKLDFTFSGKALASGVNAGAYEMGLKADQFKNTNARFTNVEFIIKADGVLTITQRPLTITAGSAEGIAPVTCDKYTVEGLATGDKVDSVKITGIQSEPGESPNVASDAVIKNAKGDDVTANYKITYVDGVLKAIEVLNKEIHFNYVIGYTDGTIRPNNDISRAEVATIFFRLLTDEAREQYTTTAGNFTDVKAGMWCNRAIATLTNMGIIKGYTDGSFQPNKSITRAELATIIARFAKLDVNTKTFSDINGHWAQKNIELAAGNGWINGYEDGTFRPNNNITRAETFAMINRVLDRQTESVSDLLPTSEMNMWSDNLNENAWYYKDVQEATNYHKCDRVGDSVYEKWTEKVPDIDWASYQI